MVLPYRTALLDLDTEMVLPNRTALLDLDILTNRTGLSFVLIDIEMVLPYRTALMDFDSHFDK